MPANATRTSRSRQRVATPTSSRSSTVPNPQSKAISRRHCSATSEPMPSICRCRISARRSKARALLRPRVRAASPTACASSAGSRACRLPRRGAATQHFSRSGRCSAASTHRLKASCIRGRCAISTGTSVTPAARPTGCTTSPPLKTALCSSGSSPASKNPSRRGSRPFAPPSFTTTPTTGTCWSPRPTTTRSPA
ncbi:hypothetical protein D9M72_524290 [compost metagenome]